MATYLDGNVRKATPNSIRAAQRSAESRRCPKCNRKSALVRISDDWQYGTYCRWSGCGYENISNREFDMPTAALTPPDDEMEPK